MSGRRILYPIGLSVFFECGGLVVKAVEGLLTPDGGELRVATSKCTFCSVTTPEGPVNPADKEAGADQHQVPEHVAFFC